MTERGEGSDATHTLRRRPAPLPVFGQRGFGADDLSPRKTAYDLPN